MLLKNKNNYEYQIKSKQDFEDYIKLITDKDDNGYKYAKQYLKKINEINDTDFCDIVDIIYKIKKLLLINDEYVTHYTSLSTLKNLILDFSEFQISEGNFMNDPSEGEDFFKYLDYKYFISLKNDPATSTFFSPKPFIGSFVTKDMSDDLTMWRFYGKEKGEEAKGCAITLQVKKFLENIKNRLSNEKIKEARLEDESEIIFYQVAYVSHRITEIFFVPNSNKKSLALKKMMIDLKKRVKSYNGNNTKSLDEELYSIAFLFKNESYKNEREVRLIINGFEFKKGYDMGLNFPRVYIKLAPINDVVYQITFGPKVNKEKEWRSAFHYRYKSNIPKIEFSHLPFN